jgi:hypothetical protein
MFDDFLEPIAVAYAAAPERISTRAITAWAELAADSEDRAAGIRLLLDVQESDDPEPYAGPGEMLADIADRKRFVVSRANSEHPIWTVAQNVAFRIVHDVLGHYAVSVALGWPNDDPESQRCTVAGFDWTGENLACGAYVRVLPKGRRGPRMALFTECIAQTAFAIHSGAFGAQKVADLTDWPATMREDYKKAMTARDQWLYV